jgi:hypothetical protein
VQLVRPYAQKILSLEYQTRAACVGTIPKQHPVAQRFQSFSHRPTLFEREKTAGRVYDGEAFSMDLKAYIVTIEVHDLSHDFLLSCSACLFYGNQ